MSPSKLAYTTCLYSSTPSLDTNSKLTNESNTARSASWSRVSSSVPIVSSIDVIPFKYSPSAKYEFASFMSEVMLDINSSK